MKKYIDSIADIMNSTSQALLIFSLALTLLGGGGLAIFGIVTFVSQLRDHKSLTSTYWTDILHLSQMAAILAIVILCIVILSDCLSYAAKHLKKHINE
ncbi:hypothetical protein [Staphylococcus capitis]|uniref:hypothetical protein n=1 Tax=Staphylococcus capitis TaxID=29388 RepID=UPI00203F616A|nr:hypothetical protein [Staphylococcus capitis]MCM3508927.1 hypothetical protein [Staphylococcus capitis]HEK6547154.1 hypothetical protein [Staphylococcus aureus]